MNADLGLLMFPCIYEAAFSGNERMLHSALLEGQNPCSFNDCGWSAIHIAASCGHLSIVKQLVRNFQCDINQKTASGLTAMHLSAQQETVEWLVSHGAEAFCFSDKGRTPLDLARREGHSRVIEHLTAL